MKWVMLSLILFITACGGNDPIPTSQVNNQYFQYVCGQYSVNPYHMIPYHYYRFGSCTFYTDGNGFVYYFYNI